MRPLLARSLAAAGILLISTAPAFAAGSDVLINATRDGAVLRVPSASIERCEVSKAEPPRFNVLLRDVSLASRLMPNRSEWLRSVRVVGPDTIGGSDSRILIETSSTLLDLRLEAASMGGVAIVLSGQLASRPVAEKPSAEKAAAPEDTPRKARQQEERSEPSAEPAQRTAAKEAPAAAPAPRDAAPQQPWRPDGDGMLVVPGGEFVMGSVEGTSFADESPSHVVRLSAFRIDAREVSAADFAASPVPMPKQPEWSADPGNPVVNVTWHEAAEYCEWRGKRLPTEAEWERAARGADRRTYPWGSQWSPARSNSGIDGDGFVHLAPGGRFPDGAGPEGALDLSGNAWEWTSGWYGKNGYANSRMSNPTGPSQGSHKVARGGSFRSATPTTATSTVRLPLPASTRRDDVGFRCASDQ